MKYLRDLTLHIKLKSILLLGQYVPTKTYRWMTQFQLQINPFQYFKSIQLDSFVAQSNLFIFNNIRITFKCQPVFPACNYRFVFSYGYLAIRSMFTINIATIRGVISFWVTGYLGWSFLVCFADEFLDMTSCDKVTLVLTFLTLLLNASYKIQINICHDLNFFILSAFRSLTGYPQPSLNYFK